MNPSSQLLVAAATQYTSAATWKPLLEYFAQLPAKNRALRGWHSLVRKVFTPV